MKKLLSISFALILIVSIFSACSNGESKETKGNKKVLVMGTSADYKPYEYVEASKSDEIIGFDVDVAKYIGKELGYEVKVKDMDFGGLLASLSSGKVDFVMAGMTQLQSVKIMLILQIFILLRKIWSFLKRILTLNL